LFNLDFEDKGDEIIQKFKLNFRKFSEFMRNVDKEIASLAVFNQKDDQLVDTGSFDRTKNLDTFAADYADMESGTDKYSNISSVQQLKHLLKNYDALVEG